MFITLEGIEGSGKSTQIGYIRDHMVQNGYDCLTTREPGGTAIGRGIRALLLDPKVEGMHPLTELLLYMADRSQHLNHVVKPALAAGKIVVCDRYFDATMVYQGGARGLGQTLVAELHRIAFGDLKPDMTFLLDLPPDVGLARAWGQIADGGRSDTETRFEMEKLSFHAEVRAGYLALARSEPERFCVVDATRSEKQVRHEMVEALNRRLGRLNS